MPYKTKFRRLQRLPRDVQGIYEVGTDANSLRSFGAAYLRGFPSYPNGPAVWRAVECAVTGVRDVIHGYSKTKEAELEFPGFSVEREYRALRYCVEGMQRAAREDRICHDKYIAQRLKAVPKTRKSVAGKKLVTPLTMSILSQTCDRFENPTNADLVERMIDSEIERNTAVTGADCSKYGALALQACLYTADFLAAGKTVPFSYQFNILGIIVMDRVSQRMQRETGKTGTIFNTVPPFNYTYGMRLAGDAEGLQQLRRYSRELLGKEKKRAGK